MRDVTKKVNAVLRHIETDDVTQKNKLAMAGDLWVAKEFGVNNSKRGEKNNHGGKEELKVILPT